MGCRSAWGRCASGGKPDWRVMQLVRFDDDSANLNALVSRQLDAIGTMTGTAISEAL
jgi:hypothetical protein